MNKSYYLGVDVGGSKCDAVIADNKGQAIGFGRYGAGNYEVVGWDGLRQALHAVTEQALNSAGITGQQLAGAGFGIAGYDWPGERVPHIEAIASLDLSMPYILVNDTLIGLVAGTTEGWGIGVVSGTGANCWGRDKQGREGQMTGGGDNFAEYGGGGDLVHKAIQAVSLAWSKRGPETKLADALLTLTGAPDVTQLLEGLMLGRYTVGASAAPMVFQVAAEGDAVAREAICWAGRELGSLGIGVIRQLSLEALSFEVVQIGSLYKGSPLLGKTMMDTIHEVAPQARAVRLHVAPVIGAVLLGMESAGIKFAPLRENLIQTTRNMLQDT